MAAKPDLFKPYAVHSFADKFPLMPADEFDRLVKSMKSHGFDKGCALVLSDDGKTLIDGRNRYLAAKKAEVEPLKMTLFELGIPGDDDQAVSDLIVRRNLERRHLNVAERSFLAVEYENHYTIAAAERKLAGGAKGRAKQAGKMAEDHPIPNQETGKASEAVGKVFQVSGASVRRAVAIKKNAADLEAKVLNHEMSLDAAAKEVAQKKKGQATTCRTCAPSSRSQSTRKARRLPRTMRRKNKTAEPLRPGGGSNGARTACESLCGRAHWNLAPLHGGAFLWLAM